MHHAEQVHVHDPPEICDVAIAEFSNDCNRGVVEHVVEAPVSRGHIIDELVHLRGKRNVQLRRLRPTPALTNGRSDFLRSRNMDIGDNDGGAVGCKFFAQGTANSGCAAGYERDPAFKFARCCSQSSAFEKVHRLSLAPFHPSASAGDGEAR